MGWTPQLVASDVDGTLITNTERITPRLRAVLERTTAAATFTLATGRPPRWLFPVLEQLPVQPICVCANGAVLYDAGADRVLGARELAPEALRTVVRIARDQLGDLGGCSVAVERVGTSAFDRPNELFVVTPEYVHAWNSADHGVEEESAVLARPAIKLLLRNDALPPEVMLKRVVPHVPGDLAHITYSFGNGLLEVSAPGVDKATGLQELAARLGVAASDVAAFGDMRNDLEMLRWAGHSVAMGNALEEVQLAADEVTTTNEDDGVARVLERWFS